jgi:hypothetical protein
LPRDEAFDPEDRDHPLVLRYDPPPDWLKSLGLPPASTQHEQARAQIAAIAIDKAWNPQPWISYSRNKNHYARRGRRYDERPARLTPSTDPRIAAERRNRTRACGERRKSGNAQLAGALDA